VVNWHRWPLTAEAVASLVAAGRDMAPRHRLVVVVVVDNESGDEDPPSLPPEVLVVRAAENLGYGGGNNRGVQAARDAHPDVDAFFILNNDAQVGPGCLARLADRLAAEPRLGLVAPLLTLPDGRVESAGGAFGLRRHWWTRYAPGQRVDFVSGAAFLIRRQAWDDVGGFDLRYFHYVEDIDLGRELARRGWRLEVVEGARVTHRKSASPVVSGILAYYSVRNPLLFWRKTHDLRAVGLNTAWRLARFLVPVRHLLRGDTRGARWAWRGLRDGLAGRGGRVS
jgi:GT2 family glycosyltransferase